jgi:membrane-associated protease RseP (regulator of RpoE activity)
MISGLEIAILLIVAWIVILTALSKRIAKTKNFQVYGPFLMLKAVKNRGILDRVSRVNGSKLFSKISVVIVLGFLIGGIVLLLYESYLATQIKEVVSVPLTEYIVLPGINRDIPLVYGSVALIFSVVIHELMHGITARKHGLPVSSVGALFFIIPIGAFVEPEQEAMMAADPVVRRRIFAAGPSINIIIALISFLILVFLLMPSVHAYQPGAYVQEVASDSPVSGVIFPGSELVSFGNYSGDNILNELQNSTILPGTMTAAGILSGGVLKSYDIPAGLVVSGTLNGFPAYNTIIPGGIIAFVDSTPIYNQTSLTNVLDSIPPDTTVSITMIYSNSSSSVTYQKVNLTTASKYDYYAQYAPGLNSPAFKSESFLGVTSSYIGIAGYPMGFIKSTVFGADAIYGGTQGFFTTLSLPFQGLSPVPSSLASLFATPFYAPLFWFSTNMLFWVFWLSFLLGLTNALPILITDGGQFLKDTLYIFGTKRKIKSLSNEKTASAIANYLGLFIVFLIFWELLIPRII